MKSETTTETRPSACAPLSAPQLFRLDGRTTIVTGGMGSMGQEVVTSIIQCGGDVICLDYPNEPPQRAWMQLQDTAKANGAKVWYYPCDVTNAETTSATFQKAALGSRYPLRGLVTCAGISISGPAASYNMADARRTIDVNLTGTFICAQAAAQIALKEKWAMSMVFIASMSGHVVNKGLCTAPYSASKAGVHQITRNLASEWGHQEGLMPIRVNSVSPGYIRTNQTKELLDIPGQERELATQSMLGRISEAEEYRGPVLFLLSDASSYMTGSDVLVDGGYSSW